MKHFVLFLLFSVFTLELYASQEIQRIDSIVNDITALRKEYREKLLEEKKRNSILSQENKRYRQKISNLKNKIKSMQTLLKNRKNSTENQITAPVCKEENPFPKLKLKENMSVEHFKARAFHFTKTADIYAGMNSSKVIGRWDKGTSFTSNIKTQVRVKITGYFVNKVWTKAKKEMWVELSNVTKKFQP